MKRSRQLPLNIRLKSGMNWTKLFSHFLLHKSQTLIRFSSWSENAGHRRHRFTTYYYQGNKYSTMVLKVSAKCMSHLHCSGRVHLCWQDGTNKNQEATSELSEMQKKPAIELSIRIQAISIKLNCNSWHLPIVLAFLNQPKSNPGQITTKYSKKCSYYWNSVVKFFIRFCPHNKV